ncbi:MAG TPA: hypothetical protein PKV73_19005, partial [Agriterribacter sp.]|nr:hypothetical protein [Agriterribacter sp.]
MKFVIVFLSVFLLHSNSLVIAQTGTGRDKAYAATVITPNDFTGSDIERIQAAINAAKNTTHKIVIPSGNSNGTN